MAQNTSGQENVPVQYPALDGNAAPPAYVQPSEMAQNGPTIVVMQQAPTVQAPHQQVIYVQQQNPATTDGIPATGQQQPVTMVYGQQPAAAVRHQSLPGDFKMFFKTKLCDQNCCCCECCSLWVGTHVWLILFMLGNTAEVLFMIVILSVWGPYVFTFINLVISLLELGVNIYCMYGLYNCIPSAFICQLVFLVIGIIQMLIQMVFTFNFTMLFPILLSCYATWVFYRVYQWCSYFKIGGYYDPSMIKPIPVTNQRRN